MSGCETGSTLSLSHTFSLLVAYIHVVVGTFKLGQPRRAARNCARFAGQNRSLLGRGDTMECSNLEEETWPIRR